MPPWIPKLQFSITKMFLVCMDVLIFKVYASLTLGVLLQGSRKITYKGLIKSSLSALYNLSQSTVSSEEDSCSDKTQGEELHEADKAIALALPEVKKSTCNVLKKFFIMVNYLAPCFFGYAIT